MDPEWLSHRKYGGPSAEDMSPIDLQDPLVALRLACYAPQVHGATARGFGISNTNASLSSTLRPPADDASCRTEGRAASRAMQEYRYNSEFGLRASANPDTLQQHFRNDINMNQIFGIFDANSANHLGEQAGDRFARDELLYLAGSSSCASVF